MAATLALYIEQFYAGIFYIPKWTAVMAIVLSEYETQNGSHVLTLLSM
jgi:hypothetical protein